jgi:hypothetical protein
LTLASGFETKKQGRRTEGFYSIAARRTALLGRHCIISVGEPWDFTSRDGDGALKGVVVDTSAETDKFQWVKIETTEFLFRGNAISNLFAIGRYQRGRTFLEELFQGVSVGSNMYFDILGRTSFTARAFFDDTKTGEMAFLVGSIQTLLPT